MSGRWTSPTSRWRAVRLSRGGHRLGEPADSLASRVDYDGGGFCVEALEEALAKYGKPEIFNTDQGSQFTGEAFTGVLLGMR